MSIARIASMSGFVLAVWLAAPRVALAQWYFDTYTGGNYTAPSTVSISQPDRQTSLEFHDVHFEAKPFKSPQFYGARFGRFLHHGAWAIEGEFLHLKVISRTADAIHVTGTLDGAPLDTTLPMDGIVQRYNMTHGLNFLTVNVAHRTPLWGARGAHRAVLMIRAGVGLTRPGVDDEVDGVKVEGYELAGPGAQAAAGVDWLLRGRLSFVSEYKITYARPRITVNGGHGQLAALTQSLTAGLGLRLSK